MQRTHDELRELIAPYALGAVLPEEASVIRAHLRTCPDCRAQVAAFDDVSASLALTVEPVALPDGFIDRTMEKVAATRTGGETARPARRWSPAWILATTTLAVACVVMGAVLASTTSRLDTEREVVTALLSEDTVRLEGDGTAAVVEMGGRPTLVTSDMEPPPEGKVYQLWRMSPGCDPARHGPCQIRSGGVIESAEGDVIVEVEGSFRDYDEAAITVEEAEVDTPTGDPVMASYEI